MSPRFRRVIAAGQVIGGVASLIMAWLSYGATPRWQTSAGLLLGIAAVHAGHQLWRGDRAGWLWSFWIQIIQMIQVHTAEWALNLGIGFGAGMSFGPLEAC